MRAWQELQKMRGDLLFTELTSGLNNVVLGLSVFLG